MKRPKSNSRRKIWKITVIIENAYKSDQYIESTCNVLSVIFTNSFTTFQVVLGKIVYMNTEVNKLENDWKVYLF